MKRPSRVLPVIVFSQFAGTSLWFATNAILIDLQETWALPAESVGWLTSAVQLGFICGTFVFALFSLADRYSARHLFLFSAGMGALFNAAIIISGGELVWLIVLRFLIGFFLAGIYPVGMKIAADWYREGLGKALGYLVGALVIGTAIPHLIRGLGSSISWEMVIITVSVLAALGGIAMVLMVPDGPYKSAPQKLNFRAIFSVFEKRTFRRAAFGYFGHMWELYAFWAFVPFFFQAMPDLHSDVSMVSFVVIGIGGLGCILGGIGSRSFGSGKIALIMLITSGLCCLFSPLFLHLPVGLFIAMLCIWGFAVVGDSPQFSTLNALNAPQGLVGTGLTIVTTIGFAITIFSIELLNFLKDTLGPGYLFLLLLPGPIFGIFSILPLAKNQSSTASS